MQAASEACLSALTTVSCQIWYKDVPVDDPLLSEAAQEGASAGAGQVLAPHDPRLILPLIDGEKTLGVLVFTPRDHAPFPVELFPPSLLPTLAAQVASALSRAALAEAHEQQVRQADRERFMSAMLSSNRTLHANISAVVTDVLPAAQWEKGFEIARAGVGGKVVLDWSDV